MSDKVTMYMKKFNIYEYAPLLFPKTKNIVMPVFPFDIKEEFCFYGLDMSNIYAVGSSEEIINKDIWSIDMCLTHPEVKLNELNGTMLYAKTNLNHMYYSKRFSRKMGIPHRKIVVSKNIMIPARDLVQYVRLEHYKDIEDDRLIVTKMTYQDMINIGMPLAKTSHINEEIELIIETAKHFTPSIVIDPFVERFKFVNIL